MIVAGKAGLGTFTAEAVYQAHSPQIGAIPMRQQRTTAAPAPARATRAPIERLTTGYPLVIDGQMKTEFETKDRAIKAGRDLKERFPMLQVKVYDAEEKRSEEIEPAAAPASGQGEKV
jgi:hypothetical protein